MKEFANITLVITSCMRYDLLEKTISSMEPWIGNFPAKILIEDSNLGQVNLFDKLRSKGWKVLLNHRQIGQHLSIDRAYEQVQTPYIFHVEDDWNFIGIPDFETAKMILKQKLPNGESVSCVSFCISQKTRQNNKEIWKDVELEQNNNFFYPSQDLKYKWNHFAFNPCLLSCKLWQEFGPWEHFVSEGSIAKYMRKKRYIRVFQKSDCCYHLGDKRHIEHQKNRRYDLHVVLRQLLKKGVFR